MTQSNSSRQRVALLVALMTLIASVYMLTYSARVESTDTLFMFDAAGSLVRFGDMRLDLSAGERRYWAYEDPLPDLPLLPVNAEPLQIVLVAPLYWLADTLPGIGRVHTVWLFNVGVAALAVGVFYLYALQLGYREIVAVGGALLLGMGTLLWAYSKTFFQEPLTLLLLLLTALWVERWRASGFRSWQWLAAVIVTFALALAARRAVVIALPTLAIIAFPYTERLFRPAWVRWLFFGLVVAVAASLYAVTFPRSMEAINRFYPNQAAISYYDKLELIVVNQAMQGFLFSIGGSVWGTSPVVLLAVPGMIMLAARNRMRYVIAALTLLLAYATVYVYVSRRDWFGGLSFPPRFLVPTLPFLMLCALPTVDYLLRKRRTRLRVAAWTITAAIIGYALWVQFNAVSYWAGEYTALLPEAARGLSEWSGGLHDVRYLRWVLLPQLWGTKPFDFAWVRTESLIFPLMFAGVGLMSLAALVWWLRHPVRSAALVAGLPLVFVMCVGVGLRLIYMDDLYLAFSDGLWRAEQVIERELTPEDMLVIAQLGHERFFLNYGNITAPRVVSLPEHPGEQPSPDQPARVTAPNPAALLAKPSPAFLRTVTQERERLWLLADSAPYIPWSVRPAERYMAAHHYPLRTIDTAQGDGLPVRLLEYVTAAYHDPFSLRGADNTADLRYGEHIRLVGYNLPLGDAYAPGDALPVSLLWLAATPPEHDYVIAFHLAGAGGVVASGEDSQPYAGFAPTTTWHAGEPIWDNRALRIPAGTPPGEYRLWVALYSFNGAGEIELLNVTSGESAEDGSIGVLPTVITVAPS